MTPPVAGGWPVRSANEECNNRSALARSARPRRRREHARTPPYVRTSVRPLPILHRQTFEGAIPSQQACLSVGSKVHFDTSDEHVSWLASELERVARPDDDIGDLCPVQSNLVCRRYPSPERVP